MKAIRTAEAQYDDNYCKFEYKMHGVRHISDKLPLACFRLGLMAAMVAKQKGGCGVMIGSGTEDR